MSHKTKTPLPKGLLEYCPSCTYYIPNSELRYPCKKSHSQVRRAAGITLARDFKECKLFEEQFVNAEGVYMNSKEFEKYKQEVIQLLEEDKQEVFIISEKIKQMKLDYVKMKKLTQAPFLIQLLPMKYQEKYLIEKEFEEIIDKQYERIFTGVLVIVSICVGIIYEMIRQ